MNVILRAARLLPKDSFFSVSEKDEMNCQVATETAEVAETDGGVMQQSERVLIARCFRSSAEYVFGNDCGGGGVANANTRDVSISTDEAAMDKKFHWGQDVFKRQKKHSKKQKHHKRKKNNKGSTSSSSSEHSFIQKLRKKSTPAAFSFKHRDQAMRMDDLPIKQYLTLQDRLQF